MKKFTKLGALLLSVIMCVGCLTGCIGGVADIEVHTDGQIDIVARVGMTEEGIKMMSESGMDSEMGNTAFEYNGVTYYGDVENQHYDTVEAFNAEWSKGTETNTTEIMNLVQTADGFKLTLNAVDTSQFVTETQGMLSAESEEELAQLEEVLKTMVYVLNFKFPYPVSIVSGANEGVSVNGNVASLDIMKMGNISNDLVIVSSKTASSGVDNDELKKLQEELAKEEAAKKAEELKKALEEAQKELEKEIGRIIFEDVPETAWYKDAVYAMAEYGLVTGVGNAKFAPQDTLTYAQFCQILARAQGRETGEQNGYWAYKAIESCRAKGDIIDLGEFTPENYDVPITREAAISGMFRAYGTKLYSEGKVGTSIKETDIPDYDKIDPNYKWDILDAYNSGITNGMDSNRTFNPKGILTRAEICQLFLNAGFVK